MGEFKKDDSKKCPLELIDPEFLMGIGWILEHGMVTYGRDNWKQATTEDIERVKGAMLRHQTAYMAGQKLDPDTGLGHMYHIATNAMFLAHYDREGSFIHKEEKQ